MLRLSLNNQPHLGLYFLNNNGFIYFHTSKKEIIIVSISRSNNLYDNYLGLAEYLERDTSSPNATGVSSATAHSYADPECVQSLPGSNLGPPAMLQFAKTRKLSVERSDPRKYVCWSYFSLSLLILALIVCGIHA